MIPAIILIYIFWSSAIILIYISSRDGLWNFFINKKRKGRRKNLKESESFTLYYEWIIQSWSILCMLWCLSSIFLFVYNIFIVSWYLIRMVIKRFNLLPSFFMFFFLTWFENISWIFIQHKTLRSKLASVHLYFEQKYSLVTIQTNFKHKVVFVNLRNNFY